MSPDPGEDRVDQSSKLSAETTCNGDNAGWWPNFFHQATGGHICHRHQLLFRSWELMS